MLAVAGCLTRAEWGSGEGNTNKKNVTDRPCRDVAMQRLYQRICCLGIN